MKESLLQKIGLPAPFGITLLGLSLIVTLAPYVGGADFGLFKVPMFASTSHGLLRLLGPLAMVASVLLHVPLLGKAPPDARPNSACPTRVSIRATVNGVSTDQNISVPAGTMVTLTATADAPLREIYGLTIAANLPYPYSVVHSCNNGLECSVSVAKAGQTFTYSGYLSNIGGKHLARSEREITVTWL